MNDMKDLECRICIFDFKDDKATDDLIPKSIIYVGIDSEVLKDKIRH